MIFQQWGGVESEIGGALHWQGNILSRVGIFHRLCQVGASYSLPGFKLLMGKVFKSLQLMSIL